MSNLSERMKTNQRRIIELTRSMALWMETPNAKKPEVKTKILELQDRTLFRLQKLEIEGQEAKIANMEKVISLLKEGTV